MAAILASWLMEQNGSKFLTVIEEKLAEGDKISMLRVWELLDRQGNLVEQSTEPQKASDRPWKRGLSRGWMVNQEGEKWLL